MQSFLLRASRSLCRRQFAHSSCVAIIDCLCWSDRLLNFSQAVALCHSLQCGPNRYFSIKSAASLAPLGRLPPSRGRSFLVSVSDTLSLNLDEDCAPVPSRPAPILSSCRRRRLHVVAFRRRSWSRDGSGLPSGPRVQQLDDAFFQRLATHNHLTLISRLWPEPAKQLVPCRLATGTRRLLWCPPGMLMLNSPVSSGTTHLRPTPPYDSWVRRGPLHTPGAVMPLCPLPRCRRPSHGRPNPFSH